MEFLSEYADHIGDFLSWISNPETSIPVVKLLQAVAAFLGALISILGFYKAWRYAESRLGKRLSEFLEKEERALELARDTVKAIRGKRSAVRHDQPKIFSNDELRKALKQVRKKRFASAETLLADALARTQEREDKAREKASLHGRQRAMAHLLLGAIADSRNDHRAALVHFQSVLDIDPHDVEALEYLGLQLLKLGDAGQALAEFQKLTDIAEKRGDRLLQAHARRNCGLAYEALPTPSPFNANIEYKEAIKVFPQNGPPLDIAYIHELRGLANIKQRRKGQAHKSLMSALTRYSQLERARNGNSKEASEGLGRVHAALAELEQLQNGPQTQLDDDSTEAPEITSPAFPPLPQQGGQQPPGNERPH